uniref:Uncharacterized protein n=1 Tax=Calidris pygmaea TaxID=425635 RepID=A0A8C3JCX9_9CHAR
TPLMSAKLCAKAKEHSMLDLSVLSLLVLGLLGRVSGLSHPHLVGRLAVGDQSRGWWGLTVTCPQLQPGDQVPGRAVGLRWRRRPWESRLLGGGPRGASTTPLPRGHRACLAWPSLPGTCGAALESGP